MSNNLLKNSSRDILNVSNLSIQYHLFGGEIVKAVDDVSFLIKEGETLGLVGESGSGKSTLGRAIIKLLPPSAKITSGSIVFDGEDLVKKSEKEMRKIRGAKISVIFQDPSSSLNPTIKIGEQIAEAIKFHQKGYNKNEIKEKVIDILKKVGIYDAEKRYSNYPYEFSIGMRQRIVIAMALITNPKLIIADEPTSALDVSTQAQILELMKQLQKEFNFSCLLISHDLAVVRYISNRVAIMYMGKIMELASSKEIIKNPLHPYTEALYSATPEAKPTIEKKRIILKGTLPSPINPPKGCRFNTRCYKAEEKCFKETPELIEIKNGHFVACHLI
ncbi:MAG: ABC transporter ATP-binding protein [Candidatus Bathyarchaeia archaeon]